MRRRRALCLLVSLAMLLCLCVPVQADTDLFFVAVNDTIPLTLTVFPTYSGGTLYVPYQVFDAQPFGVTPSYNQTRQTYVLLSRDKQMIFDLAAGTVSTGSGNTSTANVLYKNGLLYLPLSFCASHFGLKTTMLESADGYQILRFTDGSEVYDDALFVQKAENLISYRVQQYAGQSQPDTRPAERPATGQTAQENPDEEKTPSTVYLGFTNAAQMRSSMQALKQYSLHGTFFLTEAEIVEDPALVFELLAGGHTLGICAEADATDIADALCRANDALAALLCQKTLLALLPADTPAQEGYCCFVLPAEPLSAAQAAVSQTAQLLICESDAQNVLYTLYSAEANILQLLETTELA